MTVLVQARELNDSKKNKLVDELNGSAAFAALVAIVRQHHADVEVKETDILELTFGEGEKNGEGVQSQAIFVKLNDEAIIQGLKDDQEEIRVKAHFSTTNEKGEKVIRKAVVKNEHVEIENDIPFDASYFLFVEELKQPTGADEVAEIKPEAWYDGCLVFYNSSNGRYYYYRYCGKACAGSGFTQTPINPLDGCCQAHDRCYKNFGVGDDGCDWQLYTCANNTSDPGWWMVSEWAYYMATGKL